jgi:segregation and condensation protein B
MISDILLEQIIEGALMAAGQTLSIDRLQSLFDEGQEPSKERILIILERISEKCDNRGYELKKVATGYRFQVAQDLGKWVSRLWEEKPQRYSRALLETLSIIAYRQPCTRGEIEDVRGVAVSSHITKTLVEREWIQVVGHRDVPGRPAMFATTKMFLDYFNLSSLDQLPTLEEIQEMTDANHALELEEKVEEGNFDFSTHTSELEDSENLISAAKDLEDADAMVQKVEDAVFNQPEEEPDSEMPETSDLLDAENLVATLDGQLDETSETPSTEEQPEEMDEAALAEATIARMIAEQEALLEKKVDSISELPSAAVTSQETETSEKQTEMPQAATLESEPESEPVVENSIDSSTPNSIFAQTDDEDEMQAAMEEEMMAQLEEEQAALLLEQEAEQEQSEDKSLSDLANKF